MTTIKRFIKEAQMLIKDNSSDEKKVYNACKKAENHLTQALAKLRSEMVDAEISLEEKQDALHKAKFSLKWLDDPTAALREYDNAKDKLEEAEALIEDIKYSIKSRQALLASYQEEIEA